MPRGRVVSAIDRARPWLSGDFAIRAAYRIIQRLLTSTKLSMDAIEIDQANDISAEIIREEAQRKDTTCQQKKQ